MTRDTHISWRAFGSSAVTICLNDLGLSRLGFKHPTFRLRGERFNLLRHRRGSMINIICAKLKDLCITKSSLVNCASIWIYALDININGFV